MSVFSTQGYLQLNLDTEIDLTTATETVILYTKPSGRKGQWTGSVSTTIISKIFTDSDIDENGTWKFQAKFVIGGKTGYGAVVTQLFEKPLNQ